MLKDHGLGLSDVDFQPSVRTKGLQYVQLALQPPLLYMRRVQYHQQTEVLQSKVLQGVGNRCLLKPPLAESPVHQDKG